MANAWCINAYDCNGCLIQTLQNLDSACIGVGVQYTAPNPLDDKRLDYIKYTDKCWCVQCLSAENEILIYATNGVIKNLTLTNDDVNEAIKIKWNDIFWSNRAKTVVRYKTWSYPVSITDWTLAVEETTKNQYSSTPFSLSGVLDETTYYISAFAVDSNGTIIDVQSSQITTNFVFAWYQKVEYIQSSGAGNQQWQYINTWFTFTENVWQIKMKVMPTSFGNYYYTYRAGGSIQQWATNRAFVLYVAYSTPYIWLWSNDLSTWKSISVNNIYEWDIQANSWSVNYSVNWDTGSATYNWWIVNGKNYYIFCNDEGNQWPRYHSNMRLYYFQIYQSWTLVRNFVPCYRKSDNVIWLLDTVNKQFYTNQWSWSFTKWPNV